ncbi:MAG: hypothetical protein ACYSN9_04525, partial [Planctomycetota bacterium]
LMMVQWNGKQDVIGMFLLLFGIPLFVTTIATIDSYPVLFWFLVLPLSIFLWRRRRKKKQRK